MAKAVQALAAAWRYARIRSTPQCALSRPLDLDAEGARRLISAQLGVGQEWLGAAEVAKRMRNSLVAVFCGA